MQYWYCLTHDAVEAEGESCPTGKQLGPYPTREAAANALAKVEERNDEWDDDPAWNDDWGDESSA